MNEQGNIKTIHEEKVNDIYLGLFIATYNGESDTFLYCFDSERSNYIIFNTIYDLNLYVFFGQRSMLRAYLTEEKFDELYDNGIDKPFSEYIKFE